MKTLGVGLRMNVSLMVEQKQIKKIAVLSKYSIVCTLDQQRDSRLEGTDFIFNGHSIYTEVRKTNNVTTGMQLHTFISRYYIQHLHFFSM